MKFKGTLTSFDLDIDAYKKRLHEQLSENLAQSAYAWLDAALAQVPVWSGASRATFMRLAREIGYTMVINPVVISRVSFGQRHGDGEFKIEPDKGLYHFTYTTDLKWLVSNEYNHNTEENDKTVFYRLLRPGPYHFQKIGLAAFEREAGGVRLPSPWPNLKRTKHRVS